MQGCSLSLFLVQQVVYDNATALVIEGVASWLWHQFQGRLSNWLFLYQRGTATDSEDACAPWVLGHELFVIRSLRCEVI